MSKFLFTVLTLRAKLSGGVYCNRSSLFVCLSVDLLPRKLEIACIDLRQTGFESEGHYLHFQTHLQLIKFLAVLHPGKGVSG